MKNALVAKYGAGKPITERIRLWRLWEKLEAKVGNENNSLITYAKTGMLFVQEMQKQQIQPGNEIGR